MEFENDFVIEELVEFEIEGKKFKYKPTTAGEENAWLNEYVYLKDGKPFQDLSARNKCKTRNLVEVPYNKELIQKIIGIEKEWKELKTEEQWDLLQKLKPSTLNNIITNINKIDEPEDEVKKN